jgi:hypothetical protein
MSGNRGLHGDDLGTPFLRFERQGPLARCVVDRPDSRNALRCGSVASEFWGHEPPAAAVCCQRGR